MDVRILELLEGAAQAVGTVVVIDVFRAFTVASCALANGAARILPVGDLDEAYRLKRLLPDAVLMGERGGRMQAGFDYGNSPTEILPADLTGRTIIQTTSAGTQGIAAASRADEIIAGSFTTADAVTRYLRERAPSVVSLVAMGTRGRERGEEDLLCARYIAARLRGETPDLSDLAARLRHAPTARKFFDPQAEWAPESDFALCLDLNRFTFAMPLSRFPETGGMQLLRCGFPA